MRDSSGLFYLLEPQALQQTEQTQRSRRNRFASSNDKGRFREGTGTAWTGRRCQLQRWGCGFYY